jgi:hypothetical protein
LSHIFVDFFVFCGHLEEHLAPSMEVTPIMNVMWDIARLFLKNNYNITHTDLLQSKLYSETCWSLADKLSITSP